MDGRTARRRHAHVIAVAVVAVFVAVAGGLAATPWVSAAQGLQEPVPVPDTGCYIGAFARGHAPTPETFNELAGKQHAFFVRFAVVGTDSAPVVTFARECMAAGAMPMITLEPWDPSATSLLSAADIAWLTELARQLGELDTPLFVRFAHEMNGNWYPWGWGHVAPSVYIEGFRTAASIFEAHAPRTAMVWAPNQNWGGSTNDDYGAWYPGDDVVDWVGLTTYQWDYSGLSDLQFAASILYGSGSQGDFYETFAVGHGKPMMIAETACGDDDPRYYDDLGVAGFQDEQGTYGTGLGQGAQAWWIRQVYRADGTSYALNTRFPLIKAIDWYSSFSADGDFYVGGSDPAAHSAGFENYAAAVAEPYFLSRPEHGIVTSVVCGDDLRRWLRGPVSLAFVASGDYVHGALRTYLATSTTSAPVEVDNSLTISAEGTTTLFFHSEDASGACEPTQTIDVRLDWTPPRTACDRKASYDGIATILLRPDDGSLSGVERTEYRLDGGEWARGETVTVSAAGTHSLEYLSVDRAGNAEPTASVSFYLWSPTRIALEGAPLTPTYGGSARLVASASRATGAALGGRQVTLQRWSGSAWQTIGTAMSDSAGKATWTVSGLTTRQEYRARLNQVPPDRLAVSTSLAIKPAAWVGTPIAPLSVPRGQRFFAVGDLRPRHTPGTTPVRIHLWSLGSSGTWISYGSVPASVVDYAGYSRYTRTLLFATSGTWRLRASAPADAEHADAWSSGYTYVRVR